MLGKKNKKEREYENLLIQFSKELGAVSEHSKGTLKGLENLQEQVKQRDERRHEEIIETETRMMNAFREHKEENTAQLDKLEKRQGKYFRIIFIAIILNTGVIGLVPEDKRAEVFTALIQMI